MDVLFEFQENLLRPATNNFRRYLHAQINWGQRMIGMSGSVCNIPVFSVLCLLGGVGG